MCRPGVSIYSSAWTWVLLQIAHVIVKSALLFDKCVEKIVDSLLFPWIYKIYGKLSHRDNSHVKIKTFKDLSYVCGDNFTYTILE